MKKFINVTISVVISLFMIVSVFLSAPFKISAATYKDNIINAVLNQENMWNVNGWSNNGYYGYGSCEFIDLNFDGNSEFVVTYPCGSMRNISCSVFYYSNGRLVKASGGDLSEVIDNYSAIGLTGYYDNKLLSYKLVANNSLFIYSGNYWAGNYLLSFNGSKIGVNYYSSRQQITESNPYNSWMEYYNGATFWGNSDGAKRITESEYNNINSNIIKNCQNINLKTKKVSAKDWVKYSYSNKKNALVQSYEGLSYDRFGKPAAPTVSVANGVSGLDVAWGKVANAQSYVVYYKTASTGWSSVSTSAARVTLPNVQSGKYYYIQVQSIGANGVKGNYSKVKTMTYLSRANITSLTYNGNNTLKWNAVPGANKYQIARLKSGDKAYTYFYSTTPSLIEKNAVGGIAYSYQVRAMYQTSNSGTAYGAWSSMKSVPTLVAPTVTLSNKSNGIRVTWNSIRGAIRYIVYYKKSTDKGWSSAVTTNLYYPILNAQRGATYYVQVRPVGSKVSQPYSSVKSIVFK